MTTDWTPVFVLPNIPLEAAIGCDIAALAPAHDRRVAALKRAHPTLRRFLNRFADALAVQLKLVGISIEEMFDAQIAIEVMATELAAKRARADDLTKLRSILRELHAMSQKSLTASSAARNCPLATRRGKTDCSSEHGSSSIKSRMLRSTQ